MTAARPVALVTGATSGIGKAAALALADAGFEVIGTGRNTARMRSSPKSRNEPEGRTSTRPGPPLNNNRSGADPVATSTRCPWLLCRDQS